MGDHAAFDNWLAALVSLHDGLVIDLCPQICIFAFKFIKTLHHIVERRSMCARLECNDA